MSKKPLEKPAKIENQVTRFQIQPEIESACKRWKPILRTPYSETLVENEQSFNMKTGKFMISKHAINQNKDDEKCFIPVRI